LVTSGRGNRSFLHLTTQDAILYPRGGRGPARPTDIRQVGIYAGRILKGCGPQNSFNLKTAKALDLTVPPGVPAIADAVIE
jgi:hypothetical protein